MLDLVDLSGRSHLSLARTASRRRGSVGAKPSERRGGDLEEATELTVRFQRFSIPPGRVSIDCIYCTPGWIEDLCFFEFNDNFVNMYILQVYSDVTYSMKI